MGYTKRTKLTRLPESDSDRFNRLKRSLRDILDTLKGDRMKRAVTSPVRDSSVGVEIARQIEKTTDFEGFAEGDENTACQPSIDWDDDRSRTPKDLEDMARWAKTPEDEEAEGMAL